MRKNSFDKKMNQDILRVLNEVEDPELGIGIVDMGLIYRAEWTETGIEVDVTTTVLSCPYAPLLREQIDNILRERFSEALSILVQLVFDPPWALNRLSDSARGALGWASPSKPSPETFALRCWSTVGLLKN
jgi:metal-sulfur cluster biosynthetic enzyme